jgi:hypothetical protein
VRDSVSHFVQPRDDILGRLVLPAYDCTTQTQYLVEEQPRCLEFFRPLGYVGEDTP